MDKNGKAPSWTHHGEQDYGAVLLQVVLQSLWNPRASRLEGIAAVESNKDIEQLLLSSKRLSMCLVGKENGLEAKDVKEAFRQRQDTAPFSPSWTSISVNSAP